MQLADTKLHVHFWARVSSSHQCSGKLWKRPRRYLGALLLQRRHSIAVAELESSNRLLELKSTYFGEELRQLYFRPASLGLLKGNRAVNRAVLHDHPSCLNTWIVFRNPLDSCEHWDVISSLLIYPITKRAACEIMMTRRGSNLLLGSQMCLEIVNVPTYGTLTWLPNYMQNSNSTIWIANRTRVRERNAVTIVLHGQLNALKIESNGDGSCLSTDAFEFRCKKLSYLYWIILLDTNCFE